MPLMEQVLRSVYAGPPPANANDCARWKGGERVPAASKRLPLARKGQRPFRSAHTCFDAELRRELFAEVDKGAVAELGR